MGNQQGEAFGYRVLKVAANSPAQRAGIVCFFDFLVGVKLQSGQVVEFNQEVDNFFTTITENEDKPLTFIVYNMFFKSTREILLTPTKKWPQSDSLLGIMIRKENYVDAGERVLRIMKVMGNSPAEAAGLLAEEDYLLGIINFAYKDLNDLCSFLDLLAECDIKTLEMCIYNRETQKIRYVFLLPNKDWGGGGYIGAEFGTGFLNRMPDYETTSS